MLIFQPAPVQYYFFLATYMAMMIIQILVPCWFGTRIMNTVSLHYNEHHNIHKKSSQFQSNKKTSFQSNLLSIAVYNCDWTPRTRQFKSNLRLFVERANRPLSITGAKMFPLSLVTFTSVKMVKNLNFLILAVPNSICNDLPLIST